MARSVLIVEDDSCTLDALCNSDCGCIGCTELSLNVVIKLVKSVYNLSRLVCVVYKKT